MNTKHILKEKLLSLKDSILNMSLISNTRWRKINYVNNVLSAEKTIWVFQKSIFTNSGAIEIYSNHNSKQTIKWKFKSKTKILEFSGLGYNVAFISGFDETLLLLTNIVNDEVFLFVKESLWETSQLNIEKMLAQKLSEELKEEKEWQAKEEAREEKEVKETEEFYERLEEHKKKSSFGFNPIFRSFFKK